MDIRKFLLECASAGIKFKVNNGELGVFKEKGIIDKALINTIRAHKAEILALLTKYSGEGAQESELVRLDIDETNILSFQQRAIFLNDLVEGVNSKYNIPALFYITGNLDISNLQRAFDDVIENQPSLRTTYFENSGQWIQKINHNGRFEFEVVDFCGTDNFEEQLEEKIEVESKRSFSLQKDLMIKAFLAILPNNRYALFINVHHMAVDGLSIKLLLDELAYFYALRGGYGGPELVKSPVRYIDYAVWQSEVLSENKIQQYLSYWKNHLVGIESDNTLPTLRRRPKVQSYQGSVVRKTLKPSSYQGLIALAEQFDTSLFNIIYAAYTVLLYRNSGREDIVIGTPTASRGESSLEHVIGNFVNSVVLRQQVSPTQSFAQLISSCKSELAASFEHQALPFEKLIEALHIKRDAAHHPIYQVMLSFQSTQQPTLSLCRANASAIPLSGKSAKVDLYLNVSEVDRLLEFEWEYASDLFAETDIQRFHSSLELIIEQVIADPNNKLGIISVLTPQQREQVKQWSSAEQIPVTSKTVFDLLNSQHADAIALVSEARSLSYAELTVLVNANAQQLLNQGVTPGVRVIVPAESTLDTVIAALAIMRAGATYVPVEASSPLERYGQIASLCDTSILLGGASFAERANGLPSLTFLSVCDNDAFSQAITLPSLSTLEQIDAYIIFTSGSTGKPKGVRIGHPQLLNYLAAASQRYAITEQDTILQFASLGFDASIEEIFVTLCNGAKLVLKPADAMDSIATFWKRVEQHQVNVLALPTSFWHVLCQETTPETLMRAEQTIRLCIIGGETAQPWYIDHWLQNTSIQLVNTYGPTEATVVATAQFVTPESDKYAIGQPLPNYKSFVLNDVYQHQPIGVPGMLYLGGQSVAKGYLNAPEQTADAFLEVEVDGSMERVYKTGDIVRWLPSGNLEYLHRADRQLKVSGYRVDVAEVENVILSYPKITAVYVQLDDTGSRLVAYAVTKDDSILVHALHESLTQHLPRYMVPHDIMLLDELPVTANGKIDVSRLPAAEGTSEIIQPKSELESQLRELWAKALRLQEARISVHDDFFSLGGNSLKAVQLVNMLKEQIQVVVTTVQILEQGSIAALAELIETSETFIKEQLHTVRDDENRFAPFPLTEVQRAYWLGRSNDFTLGNVGTHSYTELPLPAQYIERFKLAWLKLIERHDMLRMVINEDGMQRCLPMVPEYQPKEYELHQEQSETDHFALLREEMSHHVFSGSEWPLFDIRISKLNADQAMIHCSIDALIIDASSLMLLTRELGKLIAEPTSKLPELELTFRDYVMSLENAKSDDRYEQAKQYWSELAQDFPGAPQLPLARNPQDIEAPKFERRSRSLDAERWSRLKKICGIHQLTPTCLIIDTFSDVLANWTQQQRFALNLTLFNRQDIHRGVSSLVGDFTSLSLLDMEFKAGKENRITRLKRLQKKLWKNLEHGSFDGIELQKLINQHQGGQQSYPIVLTSTLGLESTDTTLEDILGVDSLGHGQFSITQTSQVWLDVKLIEARGRLYCDWDSVVGLFPESMLDHMLDAFWSHLEAIIDSPMMIDQAQCVVQAEAIAKPYFDKLNQHNVEITPALLHQGFVEQAAHKADKVALINQDVQFTYTELDKLSTQLAAQLLENGCTPNTLLAIVMPKCWQQVVAVLAIAKAGAAYLPIDATLPESRIAELLAIGEVQLALTASVTLTLPADVKCINVESNYTGPVELPETSASAEDLAYVIFTSGSTGKPKGVAISHQAAWNTIKDVQERFNLGADCVAYGLSSLSFDLSVFDIFGVLALGGTLVLPQSDALKEPGVWYQDITQFKVNFWNSVPALFQMLNDYIAVNQCEVLTSLQTVLISGDWIPLDLFDKAQQFTPSAKLNSLGGATEASIWSIYYPITGVNPEWRSIPYGMPLTNQGFLVYSSAMNLLPPWVEGDLYISGDGLALEYWGDEEKTRQAFIYHPKTQQRLYRTGDRGRLNPEGYIEFLGRNDSQVKLQGYRIELGEIEYHIKACEGVQDCCVHVFDMKAGKKLVAYVVAEEVNLEFVQNTLEAQLPQYMVPVIYEKIDQVPLTINGKVDRAKLPAPASLSSTQGASPINLTEQTLLEIWRASLGVEIKDTNSNFFHLGGDSIKAVALVTRIEKSLACSLSIAELLSNPTIRALANHIVKNQFNRASLPSIESQPQQRFDPYPLTDVQQAYWIGRRQHFEMGNVGSHVYLEIPVKSLNAERFEAVWNAMIDRHDVLRMFINQAGMQQICEHTPYYRITRYNLENRNDTEVSLHRNNMRASLSHNLFSGEQWPLFDLRLSHLPGDVSILHYSMDELVLDASSTLLLFREMMLLMHDPNLELPTHELTFRDYVIAQQRLENSELYHSSKRYWQTRLDTLPEMPELPLKVAVSDIKEPTFYRLASRMTKSKWEALKKIASQYEVTPTIIVLGAFAEVLNRWAGTQHYVLNLTLYNRHPIHEQVNDILGDFTTLNLLEVDNRELNTDLATRFQRIQRQLWTDLEHRYYSGVEIQRDLTSVKGQHAGYPIVVTSTLGLSGDEYDLAAMNAFDVGNDSEFEFGITQTPQTWIDVQYEEVRGGLYCNWDCVRGLFPDNMLEDMFEQFWQVLSDLSCGESVWSQQRLNVMPKVHNATLALTNTTERPYSAPLLHSQIIEQFLARPEKVAVIDDEEQITYAQLDAYSSEIAFQLLQHSVSKASLVAVVMEKSWYQLAAVIGILRAGYAYLPIDAHLPPARIAKLLSLGKVTQAVTTSVFAQLVPDSIETVEADTLSGETFELPFNTISTKDLAYVIFTSGSTGEPKGVAISHQAAMNTIDDINQVYQVNEQDVCLGLSSLSFDLSVYDIFGLLGRGATVVLPQQSERRDPDAWYRYVKLHGVTIWNSVPALAQMLAEQSRGKAQLESLRLIMMSGDWIPLELPAMLNTLCPAQLVSLGGATEAAIWSVSFNIDQVDPQWVSIPYGKPLANQALYALNRDLEPVPFWVEGDLYIGGNGLSQCYWQDEAKTENSFIVHPLTQQRLYRTGDRVCLMPDGNFKFLGRKDSQVKLQGHRVELGEIESHLKQITQIENAVVSVQSQTLVAHLLLQDRKLLGTQEEFYSQVISHLRTLLPDYMVPKHYMLIANLVLTSNGKVDKSKLTRFVFEQTEDEVEPQNGIESQLMAIWSKLLDIEQISMTKDFFEVGGDSIAAIRLLGEVKLQFQIELASHEVFEKRTIKEQAALLSRTLLTEKNNVKAKIDDTSLDTLEW
ncbi:amino acid adenylation domain-containing protein [Pseudoalteromonas rhizosphaerae]|uniref:Amino acid adenylation domain-containing protein n=1 Tax=Pseudoalteromonas rhizosphaerae TaxID=2518973 RepID=A0ABW8L1U5_9GAMM